MQNRNGPAGDVYLVRVKAFRPSSAGCFIPSDPFLHSNNGSGSGSGSVEFDGVLCVLISLAFLPFLTLLRLNTIPASLVWVWFNLCMSIGLSSSSAVGVSGRGYVHKFHAYNVFQCYMAEPDI